jgi:hypothetical protein
VVVTFEENLNKMETKDLEETLEVTESFADQQELRIEIVIVDNFGSLKAQPSDQQLGAQSHRRKRENGTQENGGSRKKLSDRRRMIRREVPAVRKRHIHKRPGSGSFTRGIPNGRALEIGRLIAIMKYGTALQRGTKSVVG